MSEISGARLNARELTRTLRGAAMVRAIFENTKVVNNQKGGLHFVGQILGMVDAVSIQVAPPPQLESRCQEIFVGEYRPKLAALPHMKPDDFFHWIKHVQTDKALRLIDIRDRFLQVKRADEGIAHQLLVGQRAAVAVEVGLMCTVAAIPAAAFLMGTGAAVLGGSLSVAMAWGVGISGTHFVAKTASEVYNMHAVLLESFPHFLGTGALYAGHVMSENFAQNGEDFERLHLEVERTLHSAGEELARDPQFAAYAAAVKKGVTLKAVGTLGVVCCTGAEIYSLVKEGQKDWHAGTAAAHGGK